MKYNQILEVYAREWFDRVNGNSYFSARIILDDDEIARLPFQYGYGDSYLDAANDYLSNNGVIDNPRHDNGSREGLSWYCREHGIKLISNKDENCLKRDVTAFGKEQ